MNHIPWWPTKYWRKSETKDFLVCQTFLNIVNDKSLKLSQFSWRNLSIPSTNTLIFSNHYGYISNLFNSTFTLEQKKQRETDSGNA